MVKINIKTPPPNFPTQCPMCQGEFSIKKEGWLNCENCGEDSSIIKYVDRSFYIREINKREIIVEWEYECDKVKCVIFIDDVDQNKSRVEFETLPIDISEEQIKIYLNFL